MESDINYLNHSFLALYLASLLLTLWKAVKPRFPLYWSLVIALLALGAATLLSPAYLAIPVRYWDLVVEVGTYTLLGGVFAVIVGCVADGLRSSARRQE